MVRKSDKRARLIEAAKIYFHQKGYHQTTLANIASKARVPLGNVYYYFKTKEAIAEAAIEALAEKYLKLFDALQTQSPQTRLLSFLKLEGQELELILNSGCPIGSLCQELSKTGGIIAHKAAKVLNTFIDWCKEQFIALGFGEQASDLALQFIVSLQGIYLLAHTFKNPMLMARQRALLQNWLNALIDKADMTNQNEEKVNTTSVPQRVAYS